MGVARERGQGVFQMGDLGERGQEIAGWRSAFKMSLLCFSIQSHWRPPELRGKGTPGMFKQGR